MRSEGLRGDLNGDGTPQRTQGRIKAPICRENARPLLKGYLLFEHGSGPLKQRPGYGVLRSSEEFITDSSLLGIVHP